MSVSVYPRNLFVAVILLALFAWALRLAIDFEAGAVVGLAALIAYLVLEVGLTVNPVSWWHRRRS